MTAQSGQRRPVNDGREPLRAIVRALARDAAIKEHRRLTTAADRPPVALKPLPRKD